MRQLATAGWLVSNGRFGSALGSAFGPCGLLDWSDRLGCVPLARWGWDSAPGRREGTALFTLVRQAPPILWLSGAGRSDNRDPRARRGSVGSPSGDSRKPAGRPGRAGRPEWPVDRVGCVAWSSGGRGVGGASAGSWPVQRAARGGGAPGVVG